MEGHRATIVTHDEYKAWIEGFGVQHRAAGGDPGALMKLSVEHSVSGMEMLHSHMWNITIYDCLIRADVLASVL